MLQQPGIKVSIRESQYKTNALYAACQKNNIEIVRRFLSRADIDVSALPVLGSTALHIAAAKGHVDCVKLLLDCSALDVNKKSNGNASIAAAVKDNQRAVVRLLLRDRRTNLKTRDYNNQTLVQLAV